jgi:hypothetical protein
MYFVQLNDTDVVISLIESPEIIIDENIVKIDEKDFSLMGKKYNRQTGMFEDVTHALQPIDPQQAAIDAIMVGMADMDARQTQAIDALMSGMMELYAQNEELKAEIAALKNGGTA